MLTSYLFPIKYAFLSFPFAALLFTLPFLLVQYRKYGYVNKIRALVLYLFLLYLMNALFLVLLPLPASRHNAPLHGGALQLISLHFIADIMRETSVSASHPSTYLHLLKERAFLQVVFNILLTVPFGMILRYYFRAKWVRATLCSFFLSLFFEITQVTAIYGFYDHPYRVFDVDDLLMNTLGGMLGILFAEWLSGLLPRIERLDENVDIEAKRVSFTRRGVALLIDGFVWAPLQSIIYLLGIPGDFWISTGIYFILIPYFTHGQTLGKWAVRIRVVSEPEHENPSLRALVIRYGLLYWVVFGFIRLMPSIFREHYLLGYAYILAQLILYGWFFIHIVIHIFRKDSLLFYEKLSHTAQKISWKTKKHTEDDQNDRGKSPDGAL